MENFGDIILLALIAGFIALRLRNSLGKNSGIDPRDILRKREDRPKETVIRIPSREPRQETPAAVITEPTAKGEVSESAQRGIEAIKAADTDFSVPSFLGGARTAFEWVFDAFAKGEKDKLQPLMADSVYALFSREIDRQRAVPQRKPDATLVSLISHDVKDAQLSGKTARIAVRFVSEQVHLVRDASGAVIEGNPSDVQRVQDNWTFERDITSRSPNWKISDT